MTELSRPLSAKGSRKNISSLRKAENGCGVSETECVEQAAGCADERLLPTCRAVIGLDLTVGVAGHGGRVTYLAVTTVDPDHAACTRDLETIVLCVVLCLLNQEVR
ncbi:MAG: hypothetical protein OXB92_09000 [Acidimicrobiaceae bacterium]|nr:hypothetical protein [Acidimicrobiaceae bacterium]